MDLSAADKFFTQNFRAQTLKLICIGKSNIDESAAAELFDQIPCLPQADPRCSSHGIDEMDGITSANPTIEA